MQTMCYINDTYCTYWQFDATNAYIRVGALTNINGSTPDAMGWAGIMFGAVDSMTNGSIHRITVNNTYSGAVLDMFANHHGKPNATMDQIVTGASGHSDTYFIEVSFVRPLQTAFDQHYSIPPQPGTMTNVSVAYQSAVFEYHGNNAKFLNELDLAAIAQGKMDSITVPFTLIEPKQGETFIDSMRRHKALPAVQMDSKPHQIRRRSHA